MNQKKTCRILALVLCFVMIFAFGSNVYAADHTDSDYTNEEAATYSNAATGTYLFGGITPFAVPDENLVIVLDPGHGAIDPGAGAVDSTAEADLNLAVARYCKAYLEQFDNITVYLSHEQSYNKTLYTDKLELSERAAIADAYNADLMISIHFNSSTTNTTRGAEVYVSRLEEFEMTGLAKQILSNLGDLGLREIGVKTRASENGTHWNGGDRLADYYGIIYHPARREIPSMIIEHCFINNTEDYTAFASSQDKLKALGEADAKAIISYFGFDQETVSTTLENIRHTSLQALEDAYTATKENKYTAAYQNKIEATYADAKARIEAANNVGKIDITTNRAVKTLKNYPTGTFTDVKGDDWFAPAVAYCSEKGLFFGTTESTFSPNDFITRGQFITVIGRMEGNPETVPTQTKFSDVDPSQYYAPHIHWASEANIVAGTSATTYEPDEEIRREDLARMLHNYCVVKGIELPKVSEKTYLDFKDGNHVDEWAKEAMNWIIATGIMQGDEKGMLNPRDNTIRAEVAQIMMKFSQALEALEKEEAEDNKDENNEENKDEDNKDEADNSSGEDDKVTE
ncbi:MAG: S-layer homology domain-containing protein [Firmicutes bacterium]|nr:S-layer homology domain-containing protein [Bacillota bacterium]